MEALEIVALVMVLTAVLVVGGIWTAAVMHWLRTTPPVR
jgi:hypothetical protein